MDTLIYCFDILKIKENTEVYRKAVELAQKAQIKSNEWISAMKTIAHASRTYIFSQPQLSDFLTLAAKGIEQKKTSSEIIIFNMYRDIIENYDKFSNSLKSNFPEIIVDVISIINQSIDTNGNKIRTIGLDKYYQSRKQQATSKVKEEPLTQAAPIRTTTAVGIYNEKIPE
jgi:hypothetical protein